MPALLARCSQRIPRPPSNSQLPRRGYRIPPSPAGTQARPHVTPRRKSGSIHVKRLVLREMDSGFRRNDGEDCSLTTRQAPPAPEGIRLRPSRLRGDDGRGSLRRRLGLPVVPSRALCGTTPRVGLHCPVSKCNVITFQLWGGFDRDFHHEAIPCGSCGGGCCRGSGLCGQCHSDRGRREFLWRA